ncbi:hypothetical protein F5884DRAFT_106247 [Xylogone sp. PMI_703]|nr:hypothetical protein F5884DRAFT_106247 [Xylogone sp. PMI_703]
MKLARAVAALELITLVSAQTVCNSLASAIPSCGLDCISSAGSAAGCTKGDYLCECNNGQATTVQTAVQQCILSACDLQAALAVGSLADAVCSCATIAAREQASTTSPGPITSVYGLSACSSLASAIPSCGVSSRAYPVEVMWLSSISKKY